MWRAVAIACHFLMCNFVVVVMAIASWENGHLIETMPLFLTEPILLGALIVGNALFAISMLLSRHRSEAA